MYVLAIFSSISLKEIIVIIIVIHEKFQKKLLTNHYTGLYHDYTRYIYTVITEVLLKL